MLIPRRRRSEIAPLLRLPGKLGQSHPGRLLEPSDELLHLRVRSSRRHSVGYFQHGAPRIVDTDHSTSLVRTKDLHRRGEMTGAHAIAREVQRPKLMRLPFEGKSPFVSGHRARFARETGSVFRAIVRSCRRSSRAQPPVCGHTASCAGDIASQVNGPNCPAQLAGDRPRRKTLNEPRVSTTRLTLRKASLPVLYRSHGAQALRPSLLSSRRCCRLLS